MQKWIIILIALAYPILIYTGLNLMQARWVALLALLFFLIRFLIYRKSVSSRSQHQKFEKITLPIKSAIAISATLGIMLLLLLAIFSDSETLLLLIPTVINLAFFLLFSATLLKPPSIAERIARLTTASITPEQSRYCFIVTAIWSMLFIFNASVSLITTFFCDIAAWTLFNGLLVYFLIGALFIGEATYRYWRFRVYDGSFLDPFFRPIFPPTLDKQDCDKGN